MLLELNSQEQRKILDKILLSDDVDKSLEKLNKTGDLNYILPEVYKIVGFGGKGEGHKDLWEHTKKVVKQAEKDIIIRWAALFHDVGKPKSFVKQGEKVSFLNHEVKSAQLFRKFAKRTKFFSKEEFQQILFLIEHLGRVENYNEEWSDSAVRRFAKDMGNNLDKIMSLARADVTSANPISHQRVNFKVDQLSERIANIKKKDSQQPLLPKGMGNEIMRAFGMPADEHIGQIKNKLTHLIKNNTLKPYQEIIYYIEYLDDNRYSFGIDQEITRIDLKITEE